MRTFKGLSLWETITAVDNTNGTTLTSRAERQVSLMKSCRDIKYIYIYI